MDEALGVDGGQCPEHRNHHVQGLVHGHLPAVVGDVGLEADPLDVVHDEVGGVVLVKIAGHTGDVGVSDELGQGPGLLLEALRAVGKVLRPGVHHDGHVGPLHAGGHVAGHVLLHRHLGLELGVKGHVGDAEAALAQDAAHDVAVVEHRPRPEGHREFLLVLPQVKAAVGTRDERVRYLPETVVAQGLGGG